LTLLDRENPYDNEIDADQTQAAHRNIIYEFKPPNKQYDNDISSRSGGEKTIAGLALIFAMAFQKQA